MWAMEQSAVGGRQSAHTAGVYWTVRVALVLCALVPSEPVIVSVEVPVGVLRGGGMGVLVGGAAVLVGGTGVDVLVGSGVLVGGVGVDVDAGVDVGPGVVVGGGGVAVAVGPPQLGNVKDPMRVCQLIPVLA